MTLHSDESDDALLKAFNQRNAHAFGVVYRMIYRELYLYATRLFEPLNIPSEDIIQDVMADIWKRSSVQFPTLAYIKTFCFIALKNAYKNKLKHLGHQQRFKLECKVEYEFSDDMERVENPVRFPSNPTRRLRHSNSYVSRRLETGRDCIKTGYRSPNRL